MIIRKTDKAQNKKNFPPKKVKKPVGHPRKEIDYDRVAELASVQCTVESIAIQLGLSTSKLEHDERFKRVYRQKKEESLTELRRCQLNAAKDGDKTMLIWTGKQYLGQREPLKDDNQLPGGGTINVIATLRQAAQIPAAGKPIVDVEGVEVPAVKQISKGKGKPK